ncbi:MAG: very short patch repair endonuclease [Rikenellaceae bacterium]|nr:very short patch repair endonuclease [Rikenellaceae bacterium]
MTDIHSQQVRSYNMSRIRSKNTKPEIIVRKFLYSLGYRYRLNVKKLPGKPDIVIRKYRVVIFINGCFWHGHEGYPCFVLPKTNTEWWRQKINRTQQRDVQHTEDLLKQNWNVIIIWECQLKPKIREQTLFQLSVILSHLVLRHYNSLYTNKKF